MLCYIIGAAKIDELYIGKDNSYIIAADGGLENLNRFGIKPDVAVGDFDSLGYKPEGENIVVLPVEKDVTDLAFAVDLAEKKGFETIFIYGGTGGRYDHTLANLALLCDISKRGKKAFLLGNGFIATAVTDTKISLPTLNDGTVSVFAAGDKAEGVTIKGLKYTLDHYTLTFDNPLGVSNSFIGDNAEISVKYGTLIVIWEQKYKEFIDNFSL